MSKNEENKFYGCHVFLKNQPRWRRLQTSNKGKSLKILENKDRRWLTSDAASKRIYELYPELVLNLENYGEMKNDSVAAG